MGYVGSGFQLSTHDYPSNALCCVSSTLKFHKNSMKPILELPPDARHVVDVFLFTLYNWGGLDLQSWQMLTVDSSV